MSERPPFRVSDWKSASPTTLGGDPGPPPPPPPKPPPPGGTTPPADAPAPAAPKPASPAPSAGGPPFPKTVYFGFDLLRIPGGLLSRWWLSLPLGLLGLLLGLFAGRAVFEAQATTSARLIARDPETFAASRTAYTPSRVQGATLLQALASPLVADAVAKRLQWDHTAGEIAEMVNVQEVRRTDFVEILVHGPLTAGEAATLAGIWAEEAIAFTSGLQAQESADLRRHLEGQREAKDRELAATNARIAALREETGVIDAEREIEAYLSSLSSFHQEFEGNRVDLEAIGFQLTALRSEIRKHSPGFEELKAEEARLEELAEYYTPKNPLFQDASDRVEALRRRVHRSLEADDIDFSEFTGTYVGNALFLQILELEARRTALELRQQKLDTLRMEARERLRDLPDVALHASRLMESAQSLRAARDALSNRIQEVAGFEELAPGYYRIFRVPGAQDVYLGSPTKKTFFVGFLFSTIFLGFGLLGSGALEFLDRTLRTPGEAADIFGTEALGHVTCHPLPSAAAQQLWARLIAPLKPARARVFWVPQDHPAECNLWAALADAATSLGVRPLLLHATGTRPAETTAYSALDDLPGDQAPAGRSPIRIALDPTRLTLPLNRESHLRRDFDEIWVILHGPLREPMATTLRGASDLIILTTLGESKKDFWELQASLLRQPPCLRGLIGLG